MTRALDLRPLRPVGRSPPPGHAEPAGRPSSSVDLWPQRAGAGQMLQLQFEDHFHNFRENWQVGNESIVQIDCQVIREIVRTGNHCGCFKLSRKSARCQGGAAARLRYPQPRFSASLTAPRGPGVQTIGWQLLLPNCLPPRAGAPQRIERGGLTSRSESQRLRRRNLSHSCEMNWKILASQESWWDISWAVKRSQ